MLGEEAHDSVRVQLTPVSTIEYEVVPVDVEGRTGLLYYSERALEGAIAPDEEPVSRVWLAMAAMTFLESGDVLSVGSVRSPRPRPNSVRPDDETLLRVIRRATADGVSVRGFFAQRWAVSLRTADDWIKYARALPGANLPPARRGRPRKASEA